jgi:parallel beta-helix repeat protein
VGVRKEAVIVFVLVVPLIAGVQLTNLAYGNVFPDPGPDLPRIYIRSDGNIEPDSVPIERTGILYKLTDNIVLYTIEIQCDDVVLDGAGHTIQGNASRIKGYDDGNNGVIVTGQNNVTITRLNFEQGDTGVRISNSSHVTVVDNSFFNGTKRGVVIQDSMFVLIEANNFTDILGDYPSVGCKSSMNTVRNNIITGSIRGIKIEGSSNIISENRIESLLPIIVNKADSNTIARNNITGPSSSSHLPDQNYKGNEGIALFGCSNNLILENNITGFVNQAIRTVFTCSNNTVYGNYMANNEFAVALQDGAVNNTFYGNTFAADSCKIQIGDEVEGTCWDNGTTGNYWGDYNGKDDNGDGIGDSPYTIIGYKWDTDVGGFVSFVSDQDNYPLMEPISISEFPKWTFLMTVLIAVVALAMIYRQRITEPFQGRNGK